MKMAKEKNFMFHRRDFCCRERKKNPSQHNCMHKSLSHQSLKFLYMNLLTHW